MNTVRLFNRLKSISIYVFFIVCISLIGGTSASAQTYPPDGSRAPDWVADEIPEDDLFVVYLGWQQDPTTTMTVHWITRPGKEADLIYRKRGSSEWSNARGITRPYPYSSRQVHITEITGLQPATEYELRVGEFSTTYRFRTMPDNLTNGISFGSGGDLNPSNATADINKQIAKMDLDFVIVGGDWAYADGSADKVELWHKFWSIWHQTMRTEENRLIPVVAGIGNHEVRGGFNKPMSDAPYFYRFFSFPGSPGYNVLDFGDYLSLISLDSDHTNSISGAQSLWLKSVLSERMNFTHVIPFYHVPAYPSHRDYAGASSSQVREHWVPLFEEYGVRMAFENHDHTFKRTKPIKNGQIDPDGIIYFGDGAWGVPPRSTDVSANRWYLNKAVSINHAFRVDLTYEGVEVKAFDRQGNFFDTHFIPASGIKLLSPELNALNQPTSPVFKWEEHDDAYGYILEISENPYFSGPTLQTQASQDNQTRVMQLRQNRKYFWRINALLNDGEKIYSHKSVFTTTDQAPPVPEIDRPEHLAEETELFLDFAWKEEPFADQFHIQIAKDEEFETFVYESNDVTDTFKLVNELERNTQYFWRLRSISTAGKSEFTEVHSFTTARIVASMPYPFNLNCGQFKFDGWSKESEPLSYPEHIVFHQTTDPHPDINKRVNGDWMLSYNKTQNARFAGKHDDGIGLFGDGELYDDTLAGHPAAVTLALNTKGREQVRLNWTNTTIDSDGVEYRMRLQYRVSLWGTFKDVTDNYGNVIEYVSGEEGHQQRFRNIELPADAQDQDLVFVRWRYYTDAPENAGNGAAIGFGNLNVTSRAALYWEGEPVICEGEYFLLSLDTEYGSEFQWQLNGRNIRRSNAPFYNASASGDYRVIVKNGSGCIDTSREITLVVNPQPRLPVVRVEGGVLISSEAGKHSNWYREGVLIEAESSHHLAQQTGIYQLKVENQYGCSRLSTPEHVVMPEPLWRPNQVSVFPNPNDGVFDLMLDLDYDDVVKTRIVNLNGRTVHMENFTDIGGRYKKRFDVSHLTAGIYFLQISVNGSHSTEKFMITRSSGELIDDEESSEASEE